MQPVIITYQDVFGIWESVADPLCSRLRAISLPWKRPGASTTSVISLDLQLRPLHEAPTDNTHGGLLEKPVLNIFLVKCEDVESYRSRSRQLIRDWYNEITPRKNQEWLILLITQNEPAFGSSQKPSAAKFLSLKNSVYDKVRNDFNVSKQDRCAHIRLGDGRLEMEEAYDDLLMKIKNGITTSLDSKILAFEEDIQNMQAQKQMAGWNFCSFFILKERLAMTLQSMSLFHDALERYDELESLFDEAVNARHVQHFSAQGGFDEGDDAYPIFDLTRKAYREKIMQGAISIFDFRVYLFARQCQLLRLDESFHELLVRTPGFVTSQMRLLVATKASRPGFIESWAINAVTSVLALVPDSEYNQAIAAIKGDCKNLHRDLLVQLGDQFGLLGNGTTLSDKQGDEVRPTNYITNDSLLSQLQDRSAFMTTLKGLTESILVDYKFCGRAGSSIYMSMEMARLAFLDGEYMDATRIFDSAINFATLQTWTPSNEAYFDVYLESLNRTNQASKLVGVCLDVVALGKVPKNGKMYLHEIQSLSGSVDVDVKVTRPLHHYIQCSIARHLETHEVDLRVSLLINLNSSLPATLEAANITVLLKDQLGSIWTFTSIRPLSIEIGSSQAILYSASTMCGLWHVHSICVFKGKVELLQEFNNDMSCIDSQPLRKASIQPAPTMRLDETRFLQIDVLLGHISVRHCTINLTSLKAGLTISLHEASCIDAQNDCHISPDGVLEFHDIEPEQSIRIRLPYQNETQEPYIELGILMRYTVGDVEYTYQDLLRTDVSLLLAVNVQDFFRKRTLMSKFQIFCSGPMPIQLLEIELLASKTYDVRHGSKVRREQILVPGSPHVQVYRIDPKGLKASLPQPMMLKLSYFSIVDEALLAGRSALKEYLKTSNISIFTQGALTLELDRMISASELYDFALQKCIRFNLNPGHDWSPLMGKVSPRDRSQAREIMTSITQTEISFRSSEEGQPRIIEIPVDLPYDLYVHTVSVSIGSELLEVGFSYEATVSIEPSLHWAAKSSSSHIFTYEIEVDTSAWILTGRRRAAFDASCKELVHLLHLVPLRTGYLALPHIEIRAQELDTMSETHLLTANSQVLVLDSNAIKTFEI